MNIKIPYNLLGDLTNISFVSFILDKNDNAIYRRDFSTISDPWFFSKKKDFLIIEPSLYDMCDTIIFYPFHKSNGWGKKVIITKENKNFPIVNASLEYLKNATSVGNIQLLKRWIKKGAEIKPTANIIGSKNLIYFTAFGNNDYISLLKTLLKGLKKQEFRNFDILFITDSSTKKIISKIRDLKHFSVDYFILNKINDPVKASMQKLKIHSYPKIKIYSKILFLDMDVLVLGDLSKIFNENLRPNILYSAIQNYDFSMHNTVYHNIHEYSTEQMDTFKKFSVFPFNAGQFIFVNTSSMIKHFKNVDEFTNKWNGRFFFEQSFMNCYFNILQISNVFKFRDQFGFIPINASETNYKPGPDTTIVHYMGSIAKPDGKLKFVKKHYSHLLP